MRQKRTSDGLAVAAMIIGIVSASTMCCLGGFLGIVGIVLGIIALVDRECNRKAMAIIGLVLSAFALIITLWVLGSGNFKRMMDKKNADKAEITTEMTGSIGTDSDGGKEYEPEASEKKSEEAENQSETLAKADTETGAEDDEAWQNGEIRPEFKELVDSYEAFIDEYMEFLDTYTDEKSTEADYLLACSKYMYKYAEMAAAFSKLEDEDMNEAEVFYYTAASARISAKLTAHAAQMGLLNGQ